ncbi:MAG: hypothetical protein MJB12_05745 [Firmicutes bacterium]|nr:hypothetical protein [Bacillota bacterium]
MRVKNGSPTVHDILSLITLRSCLVISSKFCCGPAQAYRLLALEYQLLE